MKKDLQQVDSQQQPEHAQVSAAFKREVQNSTPRSGNMFPREMFKEELSPRVILLLEILLERTKTLTDLYEMLDGLRIINGSETEKALQHCLDQHLDIATHERSRLEDALSFWHIFITKMESDSNFALQCRRNYKSQIVELQELLDTQYRKKDTEK